MLAAVIAVTLQTVVPFSTQPQRCGSANRFWSPHFSKGGEFPSTPHHPSSTSLHSLYTGTIPSTVLSLSTLTFVITAHELGHLLPALFYRMKVQSFNVGFGPSLVKQEINGISCNLRAIPIGGYVEFPPNYDVDATIEAEKLALSRDGTTSSVEVKYSDDPDLLQNRPLIERFVVFSGGVVLNLILSLSVYLYALSPMGSGLKEAVFEDGVVVVKVNEDEDVLRRFDVIKSVNGFKPIRSENDLVRAVAVATREGGTGELDMALQRTTETTIQTTIQVKISVDAARGVTVASNNVFVGVERRKASTPIEYITLPLRELRRVTALTVKGYADVLFGPGDSSPKRKLTGPIGIIKQGAVATRGSGIAAAAGFASVLSVNLAVINAMPIPGLDGGQVAFLAWEKATGKRVESRTQQSINALFSIVFAGIFFYTLVGDLA